MTAAPAPRPVQRLAAYAVVEVPGPDGAPSVVLVRSGPLSDLAGTWYLPGGGLDHGEHPEAAVVREVEEETGLRVGAPVLLRVDDDLVDLPHRGVVVHTIRFVYRVDVVGGALRPEAAGTTDAVRAVPRERAAGLPLMPFVARALGLPAPPAPEAAPPAGGEPLLPTASPPPGGGEVAVLRQRAAAYGLVLDAGRVLLTRLAATTPAPGSWTLPGGGIDHGESTRAAVEREAVEETGLDVVAEEVLLVDSTHFTGRAPSGVLEDFHGVRVVHRARLRATAGEPVVQDVGGTTDVAAWVPVADARAGAVPLVALARRALGHASA